MASLDINYSGHFSGSHHEERKMKHYRLNSSETSARKDREILKQWADKMISAGNAMYNIRKNNDNSEMFKNTVEFIEWADALGYRRENK